MLRPGSPAWSCGGSVSQCLTGRDRLVSGHRPHQLGNTKCVFISENKIPLQCNSVRRTWKEEGNSLKKKTKTLLCNQANFVDVFWQLSGCSGGDVRRLTCKQDRCVSSSPCRKQLWCRSIKTDLTFNIFLNRFTYIMRLIALNHIFHSPPPFPVAKSCLVTICVRCFKYCYCSHLMVPCAFVHNNRKEKIISSADQKQMGNT